MGNPLKLISLCMIVRNEEEQLSRCLTSVQDVVDEIIVVDTGSTDRTADIARSHGATIVHKDWEGDFSKARNAGLELAKGQWILFLDADEELDSSSRLSLRRTAEETDAKGLFLQIWNVLGRENRGGTVHPVLRMFRRDPSIRFEGRIHEQIAASVLGRWPDAVFRLADAKIIHHGYKPDQVVAKNKLKRNMDLLKLAIEEDPDNGFHHYNIGVEYLRAGEARQALGAFRRVRQQAGFLELSYAHLVLKYEVRSLLALGMVAEAVQIAADGTAMYPDYPDMLHYKAVALAGMERWTDAVQSAERTLDMGISPAHFHTEDGIGTYRTAYLLGRLKETLLDTAGVIHAYVLALHHHSGFVPPIYRLCHYMRKTLQEQKLPEMLAERFTCPTQEAVELVGHILLETNNHGVAEAWLSRNLHLAAERAEPHKWIKRLLAEHELRTAGQRPKADPRVEMMCNRADDHLAALQLRMAGAAGGKRGVAPDALAMLRLRLPCPEGWEIP